MKSRKQGFKKISKSKQSPPAVSLLIHPNIQKLIDNYQQGKITQNETISLSEVSAQLASLLPFIETHGDYQILGQLLRKNPDLLFHPIVIHSFHYLRRFSKGPYAPHPYEQEEIDWALMRIIEGWVAGLFPDYEIRKIPQRGRPSRKDYIREKENELVLELYGDVLKIIKKFTLKNLDGETNEKRKKRLIEVAIPKICDECGIRPARSITLNSLPPGFPEERVQEFTEAKTKWAGELINLDAPTLRDALAYRIVGFVYHLSSNAVKEAISQVRPVKRTPKKSKSSR